MYKLSHLNKCWLLANIEKIAGVIIFIFGLLPFEKPLFNQIKAIC